MQRVGGSHCFRPHDIFTPSNNAKTGARDDYCKVLASSYGFRTEDPAKDVPRKEIPICCLPRNSPVVVERSGRAPCDTTLCGSVGFVLFFRETYDNL